MLLLYSTCIIWVCLLKLLVRYSVEGQTGVPQLLLLFYMKTVFFFLVTFLSVLNPTGAHHKWRETHAHTHRRKVREAGCVIVRACYVCYLQE